MRSLLAPLCPALPARRLLAVLPLAAPTGLAASHRVTISKRRHASVAISPSAPTITVGNSVTYPASGRSGPGAYGWGGSAAAARSAKTVVLPLAFGAARLGFGGVTRAG